MTGQEETRSPSIANRDPFTDMGDPCMRISYKCAVLDDILVLSLYIWRNFIFIFCSSSAFNFHLMLFITYSVEFFFGNMQPRNFRVYTNGPGFHAFHRNARYQQRQRAQETQVFEKK